MIRLRQGSPVLLKLLIEVVETRVGLRHYSSNHLIAAVMSL